MLLAIGIDGARPPLFRQRFAKAPYFRDGSLAGLDSLLRTPAMFPARPGGTSAALRGARAKVRAAVHPAAFAAVDSGSLAWRAGARSRPAARCLVHRQRFGLLVGFAAHSP